VRTRQIIKKKSKKRERKKSALQFPACNFLYASFAVHATDIFIGVLPS
jgi:hypothetical protein